MITKKKVIYATWTVVLLILNLFLFTFSANQSLKPWSEDRWYVDGWYCSSSIENKINENDSSYVQNRDYTCQIPWNTENWKCLFEITDTYNCKTRISKKNWWTNYFNRWYLWDYESCVFNDSYLNTDLNIHKTEDDNDLDGIDWNPWCAYDEHQDSWEPGQWIGTKLEDYCKGNWSIMWKPNKVWNSDDTNSVLWEYTSADSWAWVDWHEKDCEDYEGAYCDGTWNGTIMWREYGCDNWRCWDVFDTDTVASWLWRPWDDDNNWICDSYEDEKRKCESTYTWNYRKSKCSWWSCIQDIRWTNNCPSNSYWSRSANFCAGWNVKQKKQEFHYPCTSADPTNCIKEHYTWHYKTVDVCNGRRVVDSRTCWCYPCNCNASWNNCSTCWCRTCYSYEYESCSRWSCGYY